MQRRITVALVGVVVVVLLLTGLGTFALTHVQARRDTQDQLQGEVRALEPFIVQERALLLAGRQTPTTAERRRLATARASLSLADASVLLVDGSGEVVSGTIPDGVSPAVVAAASRPSTTSTGRRGQLVWATASSTANGRGRVIVVVLTRSVPYALGSIRWLALSGGVALILAVLVSWYLGRALSAPLRAVDLATRRIADGDLTTRLPEPAGGPRDELADLARAINAMAATLQRSRGLEQQFLMSVSHDLRTPLTSIRGYAEAIGDGAVEDVRAAAGVILAESRRLERLVKDLLDLSRLDARQFSLRPEPLDLAVTVATAVEGFRPRAAEVGIALDVVGAPPGSCRVVADRDRFVQVLANLVENGLKFARSTVRVEVGWQGGGTWVAVVDDGPGIAADDLPHVFDRLYVSRAEPVRRESGSGLGLAIARELTKAMGGEIAAWPGDDGVGTRMVFTLPLAPPS